MLLQFLETKKVRELHDEDNQKLRKPLGKCNSLHKIKKLNSFYTMSSKIKIRFERKNEEVNTEMNHEADLVGIFGVELISSINRERKRENAQK